MNDKLSLALLATFLILMGVLFVGIQSSYTSAWNYRQMRNACENYPDIVYTCEVACPLFQANEGHILTNWTNYYAETYKRPRYNNPYIPPFFQVDSFGKDK